MSEVNDRCFPNEIFTIIINFLDDDQISLRNTALVCKDFKILSQPHLFRNVDLRGQSHEQPLLWIRFAALLQDPGALFGNLVQNLQYSYLQLHELQEDLEAAIIFILQSLPSITELRIEIPLPAHFPTIATSLGAKLEELWLETLRLDQDQFELFQRMLSSLAVLKSLAMRRIVWWSAGEEPTLILPSSLRAASFTLITSRHIIQAIGRGMERSPTPKLDTLFVDTTISDNISLWRALGLNTRVVLDIGTGLAHFENSVKSGLRMRQLIVTCLQRTSVVGFFVHFIPLLPDSICEICIDFLPTGGGRSSSSAFKYWERTQNKWIELDKVLMHRHELGLLKRVCFRCTSRANVKLGYNSRYSVGRADRTILTRLESFLPGSQSIGLIEVDHHRKFFEATM